MKRKAQSQQIKRIGSKEPLSVCLVPVEDLEIVLVDEGGVRDAQEILSGCEQCVENATLPFDYILDALTESDPTITEYLMSRVAICPVCKAAITEKTLVLAC